MVISTPSEVIKEFNNLVFHFLWNRKDKVIRSSTFAPYEQGGLRMIDYETMSWLKRITDENSSGVWKCYFNYLLENEGGLFLLLQCNYDVNQINITSTFYHNLLAWWSNIREVEVPNIYTLYVEMWICHSALAKLTYIRDIADLRAKTWLWYQQSGEHCAGQALIVIRISLFDQF